MSINSLPPSSPDQNESHNWGRCQNGRLDIHHRLWLLCHGWQRLDTIHWRPETEDIMNIEKILRRISLFDSVEENALPEQARSMESIELDADGSCFTKMTAVTTSISSLKEIWKSSKLMDHRKRACCKTWALAVYWGKCGPV